MSQPALTLTRLDNQLGVVPVSQRRAVGVIGVSDAGTFDLPTPVTKVSSLTGTFGNGAGVEAAAHNIDVYGNRVLYVRCNQSVPGAFLDAVAASDGVVSLFDGGTGGTSVITEGVGSLPLIASSTVVIFDIGGTVGTTGIVYRVSTDGGVVFGPVTGLGTAVDFDPITGVTVELAAGTVTAGRLVTFTTTAPILASAGQLVVNFTGTSVPTIAASPLPIDDYEVKLVFVTGGTIGVAGITYTFSLDDGRTNSAPQALGTAVFITVPGGGQVDLAAGTIVAADNLAYPTVSPTADSSDLTSAFQALRTAGSDFEQIFVATPLDAALVTICDAQTSGMSSVGKHRYWRGSTRLPVGAETEATYLASLTAVFAASSSTFGDLCAGACEFGSGVNGAFYRRPAAFAVGAREAALQPEVNAADSGLSALPVTIKDALGNPKHHDETFDPGLDDQRFTVLRTITGVAGVYINRARAYAPVGSDFSLSTYVRVMILALDAAEVYFGRRLNAQVAVDPDTGLIDELAAQEIEQGATAALTAKGLNGNQAIRATFVLNRDDNVLSSKTLTGKIRVTPFGYVEFYNVEVGFFNPALAA